jgi:hypothetical protein
MPAISFHAVLYKALDDYREQIGAELDDHPFADELRGRDTPMTSSSYLKPRRTHLKPIGMEIAS